MRLNYWNFEIKDEMKFYSKLEFCFFKVYVFTEILFYKG